MMAFREELNPVKSSQFPQKHRTHSNQTNSKRQGTALESRPDIVWSMITTYLGTGQERPECLQPRAIQPIKQ